MAPHVCPWWLGWILANPLRRLLQDPAAIVAPLVRAGMTVLEPGPGVGYFTVELARAAGPGGRVVAVELQPRMLSGLRRRLERAGLAGPAGRRQRPPKGTGPQSGRRARSARRPMEAHAGRTVQRAAREAGSPRPGSSRPPSPPRSPPSARAVRTGPWSPA